jgi:hypothetical protein
MHIEELHNFYSSQNIVTIIKLRSMRFEGHIARMRQKRYLKGFGGKARRKDTTRNE